MCARHNLSLAGVCLCGEHSVYHLEASSVMVMTQSIKHQIGKCFPANLVCSTCTCRRATFANRYERQTSSASSRENKSGSTRPGMMPVADIKRSFGVMVGQVQRRAADFSEQGCRETVPDGEPSGMVPMVLAQRPLGVQSWTSLHGGSRLQ